MMVMSSIVMNCINKKKVDGKVPEDAISANHRRSATGLVVFSVLGLVFGIVAMIYLFKGEIKNKFLSCGYGCGF